MGRALLIGRLAIGELRRRGLESALVVLMLATATTMLALGLVLGGASKGSFALTRALTRGPDMVAEYVQTPDWSLKPATAFAPLVRAPAVIGASGPYPVAFVRLRARGMDVLAQTEGRDRAPAAIDQPLVTAGNWVRPGDAVIERSFADQLGLRVGDTIALNGRPFPVTGIAVTTGLDVNLWSSQDTVWLVRADTEGLATRQHPLGYVLDVRLADPSRAAAFLNSPAGNAFCHTCSGMVMLEPWQWIGDAAYRPIARNQGVLVVMSWFIAILATASIAVVVEGRMIGQTRRVGLLKAVGATPRMVAAVLLAENLLLALAAAALGLAAAHALAPLLTNPGDGLLGPPTAPSLSAASTVIVLAAAAAIALAATLVPTVRTARATTMRAITDAANVPSRAPALITFSAWLPFPLLFGLRLAGRRPRRTALTIASMTFAVAWVVTAITLQHQINFINRASALTPPDEYHPTNPLTQVITVVSVALVIAAAITTIFSTWTTVMDAQRPSALARAFGATPRQIAAGLTVSQVVSGLAAACLGIPAGLLLYATVGGRLGPAAPRAVSVLAVIPGTMIAVALLTAIPSLLGARRSIAGILRTD
ncbi:MAG: ABC transporter permease [Solirubrobacterales bacterium]|nr:ABC transporter permease [Solirubrobacterales bacterium]